MNIRRLQPGEELALFEVYYSAIHLIARDDYSEEQLNAWAPSDLDRHLISRNCQPFSRDQVRMEEEVAARSTPWQSANDVTAKKR